MSKATTSAAEKAASVVFVFSVVVVFILCCLFVGHARLRLTKRITDPAPVALDLKP
jgi:hypothetical protein